MDPIVTDLNELAKLREILDEQLQGYDAQREQILAPVRAELDALNARMEEDTWKLQFQIGALEARIKDQVLGLGTSVKADQLQAIYTKPRVTWDLRGLEGFMVAHPEISAFRKVGQPSVSFRKVAR